MKIERMKITPALARKWLESVPDFQRRVTAAQVDKIASAIEARDWRENGATFVFNSKGEFVDGQHRAKAIVQANRPVWGLVVRQIDPTTETFQTIDDAKSRSIADFLHMPSAPTVAAVARLYWLVQNGHWKASPLSAFSKKVPIADCLKLAHPHLEEIGNCVRRTHAAGHVIGEGAFLAFLCFYYTIILHHDEAAVGAYFDRLTDGVNLNGNSPIGLLRNRMLGVSKMGVNFKLSRYPKRALIVKSLNAALRGVSLKALSWNPAREPFPPFAEPNKEA